MFLDIPYSCFCNCYN